jgi:hypothetical protein
MIRKLMFAFLICAGHVSGAHATTLLPATTITTAQTGVAGTALQTKDWAPENVSIQCNFTYGSGGTSTDVYVQTSLDGGATWTDLAECNFTTATARKVYNVSGLTGGAAALSATDGSLAANTALAQGVMGSKWRTKLTTVGTYAGGTTLQVDVIFGRARGQP